LGQATDIGAAATMLSVVRRASLGWREPLGKVARICGDTSPSNARPANDLRAAAPCRVYAGEQLAPLGQPRLSGWTLEPMTQHSRLDHPRIQGLLRRGTSPELMRLGLVAACDRERCAGISPLKCISLPPCREGTLPDYRSEILRIGTGNQGRESSNHTT
jgi:hypothetical protein